MSKNKHLACWLLLLCLLPLTGLAEGDLYTGGTVEYKTGIAKYGDVEMTMLANAEMIYPREVNVRYDGDVTGTFLRYQVIKGTVVKAGDVLAVVTGNVSKAQVEQARLRLLRAQESQERQLKADALTLDTLQHTLRAAKDGQERARAQLALEKAQLENDRHQVVAERNIQQLQQAYDDLAKDDRQIAVLSPVDGIVKNTRDYAAGDQITPEAILSTVYVTTDTLLSVTSRWGTPSYGARVMVKLGSGASARDCAGTVVASDNMLPSMDKTGRTYVRLDNGVQPQAEQQLSLYFPIFQMEHVLLVDQSAVHTDGAKTYVYLYNNGIRQKQYVTIVFSNATIAWILDGLTPGDVVIIQ